MELIDRQAAIDAFNTGLNELVVDGEENAKTVENYLNRVIEKIKCLPPAQSEIVRCKDCKYYTPVTAHCEIRGKGLYLIRGMEDFCSRAERRADE